MACAGLLISLLYEPCAGFYRVEQRPQRFLAVTLVNVFVTVVISVVWIVHFDGGAFALVTGSFTGTLVALTVVLWDRRRVLFGSVDRSLVAPMLHFGLPFMPSRVALWALNLSNRLLVAWLATRSLAGRVRRGREPGPVRRAARDGVPAGLAALRVRDQGRR